MLITTILAVPTAQPLPQSLYADLSVEPALEYAEFWVDGRMLIFF